MWIYDLTVCLNLKQYLNERQQPVIEVESLLYFCQTRVWFVMCSGDSESQADIDCMLPQFNVGALKIQT